jgi:hypothetical protein
MGKKCCGNCRYFMRGFLKPQDGVCEIDENDPRKMNEKDGWECKGFREEERYANLETF